jgi:hypothetical protein
LSAFKKVEKVSKIGQRGFCPILSLFQILFHASNINANHLRVVLNHSQQKRFEKGMVKD